MKILLIKDVSGLGRMGDIKEVSDGHARNFLLPKMLAVIATESVLAKTGKESIEREQKQARDRQKFAELVEKLGKATFIIRAKASKEHLFAAIHEDQIAQAINSKMNIDVPNNRIFIERPIKQLGEAKAIIKLDQNHKTTINLDIRPL